MSAPIKYGFSPCFFKYFANLPAKVVFPAPWSPASITTVGFLALFVSLEFVPPNNSTNSSFTIFINCCPGLIPVKTSAPIAFSWIFATKSLTTL